MKAVITGAGQIAQELILHLADEGVDVTVPRRTDGPTKAPRTIVGDAGDRDLLRKATADADVIYHCIHAPYSPKAWRRELPHREQAVMDVAAERGIPVVFPESVYAFGHGASDLHEGAALNPCTPLGEVRAELLDARSRHTAPTVSIVASDLIGPTPSPVPLTLDEFARLAAQRHGRARPRLRHVPPSALGLMGLVNAQVRALHEQLYLWDNPVVLHPGQLVKRLGMRTPAWDDIHLEPAEE